MAANSTEESVMEIEEEREEVQRGRGQGRGRGSGRGRGRGSGRGRGRGRGRRGGRGRHFAVPLLQADEAERLRGLRQQREDLLKNQVSQLALEDAQGLLMRVVDAHPCLLHDLISRQPTAQASPRATSSAPPWCMCGNCSDMQSLVEQVCCNCSPCTSTLPDMELVILDKTVLSVQMMHRRDMLGLNALSADDINRSYRHAAYRQYVWWTKGSLGQGRVVIPSCCVIKIRNTFPDTHNVYTGYKPQRLI